MSLKCARKFSEMIKFLRYDILPGVWKLSLTYSCSWIAFTYQVRRTNLLSLNITEKQRRRKKRHPNIILNLKTLNPKKLNFSSSFFIFIFTFVISSSNVSQREDRRLPGGEEAVQASRKEEHRISKQKMTQNQREELSQKALMLYFGWYWVKLFHSSMEYIGIQANGTELGVSLRFNSKCISTTIFDSQPWVTRRHERFTITKTQEAHPSSPAQRQGHRKSGQNNKFKTCVGL